MVIVTNEDKVDSGSGVSDRHVSPLGRGFTVVGNVLKEAANRSKFVFDGGFRLHAVEFREMKRLCEEGNFEIRRRRSFGNLGRDRGRFAGLRERVLTAEQRYAQ